MGRERYFFFFYCVRKDNFIGNGNLCFKYIGFPSRYAVISAAVNSCNDAYCGGFTDNHIVITGFNELTEEDYTAWKGKVELTEQTQQHD